MKFSAPFPYVTAMASFRDSDKTLVSYTQPAFSKIPMFQNKNFYFMDIQEQLDTFSGLFEGNFTVIDTETNGRNVFGESLPFQIAAIKYRNWKPINEINIIMNIGEIPEFIQELTSTPQSVIDNAENTLAEGIQKILNFLQYEKYIVAHNASFDVSVLNNALVASETYIQRNYYVLCSMQMYYVLNRHIRNRPTMGSSLDTLGTHLLGISIDTEARHQADYDCIMTAELLYHLQEVYNADLALGEDSYILSAQDAGERRADYLQMMTRNPQSPELLKRLAEHGNSISDDFETYIEKYYYPAKRLGEAIVAYLAHYNTETIDTDNFYVKRNSELSQVKDGILKSYYGNQTTFTTRNGYEIQFLKSYYEITGEAPIVIQNQKELESAIEDYYSLMEDLIQLQNVIKSKLKIIRAHHRNTGNRSYGDLLVETRKVEKWQERLVNEDDLAFYLISEDITNLDELYEEATESHDPYLSLTIINKSER